MFDSFMKKRYEVRKFTKFPIRSGLDVFVEVYDCLPLAQEVSIQLNRCGSERYYVQEIDGDLCF